MDASSFDGNTERPGTSPPEPQAGTAPVVMAAPREADEAEARRDETPEEPGYGHGV
jgi:hypothetical protein